MKSISFITIAVDGGAASGKSSTAQGISNRLHFMHADTGQNYRLLSYILLNNNIASSDIPAVKAFLEKIDLKTILFDRKAQLQMLGHGEITSEDLRSEAVNACVSSYSTIPELRTFLLNYQRNLVEFAKKNQFHGIVMEGRDIGTTVLPYADFKFFLHADLETRSKRRIEQGQNDLIEKRDIIDSKRAVAPLACALDAINIDNSNLSLEEVIDFICQQIQSQIF